jgi:hypothetical protein
VFLLGTLSPGWRRDSAISVSGILTCPSPAQRVDGLSHDEPLRRTRCRFRRNPRVCTIGVHRWAPPLRKRWFAASPLEGPGSSVGASRRRAPSPVERKQFSVIDKVRSLELVTILARNGMFEPFPSGGESCKLSVPRRQPTISVRDDRSGPQNVARLSFRESSLLVPPGEENPVLRRAMLATHSIGQG